jgi:hypothetical protein
MRAIVSKRPALQIAQGVPGVIAEGGNRDAGPLFGPAKPIYNAALRLLEEPSWLKK